MAEILDIISQNTQSTVVAEYVREVRERETGYQSEAELEELFEPESFLIESEEASRYEGLF